MSSTNVGSIYYDLNLNSKGFESGLKKIKTGLKKAAIGIAALGAVGAAMGKSFVSGYMEAEEATAQLNAVLKSTKGVAGITAKEVDKLANKLEGLTKFSREQTLEGQNLLLTFTKIGKDIFPEATKVMLDMSTALGQDMKSSAVQLGKALQDPILGVTALRRVGVNFNDEQREVIKNLVETGRAAEAQRMILEELKVEFGGSAIAAGETFGGQLTILQNKIGALTDILGEHIVKALGPWIERITNFVESDRLEEWVQGVADGIVDFSKKLYEFVTSEGFREFLKNAKSLLDGLVKFITNVVVPVFSTLFGWLGKLASNTLAFNLALGSLATLLIGGKIVAGLALLSGGTAAVGAGGLAGLAGTLKLFIGKAGLWGLFAAAGIVAIDKLRGESTWAIDIINKKLAELGKSLNNGVIGPEGNINSITTKDGKTTISSFAPYAEGGPFSAGQPMLVGEKGPEMIVPRSAGEVIPNNQLGGSMNIYGGVTVNEKSDFGKITSLFGYNQELALQGVGVRR